MFIGWQWYYRRYIDVKKGGVGGVAMLLAGYCVLSYTWNYPHISKYRNSNGGAAIPYKYMDHVALLE